jgi:protein-L-isoaspartate(D-aspartate) O-methyltransferase
MTRSQLSMIVCWAVLACAAPARGQAADANTTARNRLVDDVLAPAGIQDPRVIDAMRTTPRHEFVPPKQRKFSYFDMALPIGHGQTISPPFGGLRPSGRSAGGTIAEIGTGSGQRCLSSAGSGVLDRSSSARRVATTSNGS